MQRSWNTGYTSDQAVHQYLIYHGNLNIKNGFITIVLKTCTKHSLHIELLITHLFNILMVKIVLCSILNSYFIIPNIISFNL